MVISPEEESEVTLPNYPQLDMFSAGINALYGVLVAGQPSHNRGFTAAGLVIMAFFGGIGGGVTRDVLLNDIPSPFRDPTYLLVCVLMALIGLAIYHYAATREERFRTRTMAFLKSLSLPWFAILGAHKALEHGLGIWTAILVGVIATNAGGVLIDIFSGVTPDIVKPSEQLFTASVLAGAVYTGLWELTKGRSFFPVTLIAVGVTFVFRVLAVKEHFPSIVPTCTVLEAPESLPLATPAANPVARR